MSKRSHGIVFEQDRKYAELLVVLKLVTDKLWEFFKSK
jgi:hypothetical protein